VSLKPQKNLEIEQLRAVAICLVLVAHVILLSPFIYERVAPLFQYASFGVGVDLFFCISGYVVASAYCDYFDRYRELGKFWPSARAFWLRRCYRLLPSAWLWVIISLICAIYFNRSGVFMSVEQNLKSALAIFSFTGNIAHMYGWLAPNNVYWSLALEEQFYILLPLFLLVVTGRRARIFALLLVIAVQFPLARNPFGDITSQYLASFRIDGFAWGILIAMYSRSNWFSRLEPRVLKYKPLALIATLVLLYLLVAVPARLFSWSINMGLLAMIAAALVWLASYGKGYLFGYRGLTRVMIWLGARSYGIYLIHLPVFHFTHEVATRYLQATGQEYSLTVVPFLLVFAFVLIALLAELNFRYIEDPLRRIGSARAKCKLAALKATSEKIESTHVLAQNQAKQRSIA
jgi:peptidoglycan/LPS O-acetylase OafA/YrhL